MVPNKLPTIVDSPHNLETRTFRKVPLYLVMMVPLLVQVVGVVTAVGWLSYRNGQQTVRQVATQLRSESSSRIQQHLNAYLATPIQINQINADAVELGLLDLRNFSTTGKYFWRQMQAFNVGYISFGTPTGDFIGVERLDSGKLLINEKSAITQNSQYTFSTTNRGDRAQRLKVDSRYNPLVEGWYTDAVAAGKPIWSSIYQWDDKPNVLSISASHPLYDANRRLVGVLSVDQILTQISDFLSGIHVSQTGRTYIMERSGDLVATSLSNEKPFQVIRGKAARLQAVASQDALIRASAAYLTRQYGNLQQIQHLQQLDFQAEEQNQFLLVMPWKDGHGLDWLIVVVVPEADFMAQIHNNTRNTILSCAIALAVATLLGIPISRWIAQQILRLSQASEALADGQLHQVVRARGITELETLAQSFNRMAEQLRTSFTELEQTNEVLEQKVEARTASLTAAEAELRALFMAMNDLVIVYDRQGVIQKIVSTHPNLVMPATDQVGKSVIDLLTPSHAEAVMGAIQQVFQTQNPATVEYCTVVEGQDVWFSANISPLFQDQVLFVARDVSDRKRAEAALQEKEQYLRLILNNIPQQVFWKGTNLTFLGCNRNWANSIGLSDPEEIIGKTDYDLLPNTDAADQFRAQDLQIMASGIPVLHQIAPKVQSSNDKITWLDICKVPIHDAQGNVIGVLGVIDDITPRKEAEEALKIEQEKTELLLLNVLPDAIAQQLKQSLGQFQVPHNRALIAESFEQVTVLFADIVNFTTISSHINAADLVGLLNRVFLVFDDLCDRHGLEKIKTIGDAYMVVGGLPNPRLDHAEAIANMALDMQREIAHLRTYEGGSIEVRVGINTGPVIAGVIGKKKFTYDLWGDVVNTASRMESHSIPGRIQVTAATYERLKHAYQLEYRGAIEVKGKGEMHTYWLTGRR